MEPMIQVRHLTKRFQYWSDQPGSVKTMLVDLLRGRAPMSGRQTIEVLDDVNFEIGKGEFVGIMGRNGCGKSTILKLICGIYAPTSGEIIVKEPIAPLIELGAGFHGELSGYENIHLNAAILGFGRKATMDAIPKILEFSELGDRIHMPVRNYSSGMLVRLGFSVATHLSAPIILMDEVLAVGDAGFQAKCLKKIEQLHGEGRTVVFVTHDAGAVKNHCDRCIVLSDRKKIFDGDPGEGTQIYLDTVLPPAAAPTSTPAVT